MVFSSLTFLTGFLPVFLMVFFLVPRSWQNGVLLLFSLAFYGWFSPALILLIVFEILVGWIAGRMMQRYAGSKRSVLFWVSIAIIVGLLFFFKYWNFFAFQIVSLGGPDWVIQKLVLPLGISFYTFQILSYLIDVKEDRLPAQSSLIRFALYVSMFFQLVAGPIVRYQDMEAQLDWKKRTLNIEGIWKGIERFCCGLAKKVILANGLWAIMETFRTSPQPSVLYFWLYAIAGTMFVYYDFSGYSDMAIGLGHICGFHLPENFNYPFTASSFTGFWRRWHMSLTSWFRDYIYIPLGGNRKGKTRQIFNLLVVWLLTGFWHGAAWTYVCWGLLFFVLLVMEKFVLPEKWVRSPIYGLLYRVILLLSFCLFLSDSLPQFGADLMGMFGLLGLPFSSSWTIYALLSNLVLLLVSIVGLSSWPKRIWQKMLSRNWSQPVRILACAIVFVMCLAWLASGTFNPFLYFSF